MERGVVGSGARTPGLRGSGVPVRLCVVAGESCVGPCGCPPCCSSHVDSSPTALDTLINQWRSVVSYWLAPLVRLDALCAVAGRRPASDARSSPSASTAIKATDSPEDRDLSALASPRLAALGMSASRQAIAHPVSASTPSGRASIPVMSVMSAARPLGRAFLEQELVAPLLAPARQPACALRVRPEGVCINPSPPACRSRGCTAVHQPPAFGAQGVHQLPVFEHAERASHPSRLSRFRRPRVLMGIGVL